MGEWGAGQDNGKGEYSGSMGFETREEAEREVEKFNKGECSFPSQRDVEKLPYVLLNKGRPV
jgi:hypothetical protein